MKKMLLQYTRKNKILLCIIALVLVAILLILLFRHIHSFDEWQIYRKPSCSDYGIERRYCDCGEMQEKQIALLDHTEGDWEFDEANSLRKKKCTVCGTILKTESLANHSHTFSEWMTINEVSCTSDGLQSRNCTCGFKEEKIIKAGGHTFGDWSVTLSPTCSNPGSMERSCPCGHNDIQELEQLEHIMGNWILNGIYKEYPCINCGDVVEYEAIKTSSGLNINGSAVVGIGTCKDRDIVIPEQINEEMVESIHKKAFQHSNSIDSIIIPNSVKSIGNYAFYEASSLKAVHLGSGITDIGEHAFGSCTNLQEISIPHGVTHLRESTFEYCASLNNVRLPNTLVSIEALVFYYCGNLTNIYFDGTVKEWNAIEKHENWNVGIDDYTIYCSNGNITN